jgi:hypothetical protein
MVIRGTLQSIEDFWASNPQFVATAVLTLGFAGVGDPSTPTYTPGTVGTFVDITYAMDCFQGIAYATPESHFWTAYEMNYSPPTVLNFPRIMTLPQSDFLLSRELVPLCQSYPGFAAAIVKGDLTTWTTTYIADLVRPPLGEGYRPYQCLLDTDAWVANT